MTMLKTKEHYDLLDAFERNHRDLRLDRENRALWAKGRIYQSGEANSLFLAFRNGYALGKVICREDAGGHTPSTVTPAEVGGLVERLRDTYTKWNNPPSDGLPHGAGIMLQAATALEAQAAELSEAQQRYVDANEARIDAEARLAEALKALDLFEHYGCPICHGDCASANPPVDCCPMEAARRVREGGPNG